MPKPSRTDEPTKLTLGMDMTVRQAAHRLAKERGESVSSIFSKHIMAESQNRRVVIDLSAEELPRYLAAAQKRGWTLPQLFKSATHMLVV